MLMLRRERENPKADLFAGVLIVGARARVRVCFSQCFLRSSRIRVRVSLSFLRSTPSAFGDPVPKPARSRHVPCDSAIDLLLVSSPYSIFGVVFFVCLFFFFDNGGGDDDDRNDR
uniref:Transmembrane protein n=1 Tax=Ananas comosus var. bracteatus TaxID=296719 RepID=A0A6V7QDS3_ANACO|nr:unnamed protein product [Ananas comosus var. bracteatus]